MKKLTHKQAMDRQAQRYLNLIHAYELLLQENEQLKDCIARLELQADEDSWNGEHA